MARKFWTAQSTRAHVFCAAFFLSAMTLALPVRSADAPDSIAKESATPSQAPEVTRLLAGEVGFRNEAYDRLKKMYGYPWLYPQAFAIDPKAKELFIMLGGMAGKNKWGWIQVYDLDSFALKSTFSTGQRWREGLVIRWTGTRRFLYTMGNTSLIRLDVTQLPQDIGVVESEALPARAFSMMTFGGRHFVLQQPHGTEGFFGSQQFNVYDETFQRKGAVTLSSPKIDSVSVPGARAKMQGIASDGDRFYAGFGGAYVPGVHKKDDKWQGTAMFDHSGALLASSVMDPDQMGASLMRAIGYRPTCVENEGVAVADNKVYSIWITLGPKDREKPVNAGKGVVLMREVFTASMDGGNQ